MNGQWFVEMLKNTSLWSAVSAIATVVATIVIYYVSRQFKFESWNKCQEVFTEKEFTEDRRTIFQHLNDGTANWTQKDIESALRISGKMDELCRLAPFFGKRQMIKVWGDPIGKSWALLNAIVQQERSKTTWQDKWMAFQNIGSQSLKKLPKEKQNQLNKLGKQFGVWAATAQDTHNNDAKYSIKVNGNLQIQFIPVPKSQVGEGESVVTGESK